MIPTQNKSTFGISEGYNTMVTLSTSVRQADNHMAIKKILSASKYIASSDNMLQDMFDMIDTYIDLSVHLSELTLVGKANRGALEKETSAHFMKRILQWEGESVSIKDMCIHSTEVRVLLEFIRTVNDYPVYDEDVHSELVIESAKEFVSDCVSEYRAELHEAFPKFDFDGVDGTEMWDLIHKVCTQIDFEIEGQPEYVTVFLRDFVSDDEAEEIFQDFSVVPYADFTF